MYYLAVFALYAFVFAFGSIIGSFLNVVVYRVPNGLSVAEGRSFCPRCHAKIRPYDLIPVLSWFILKGKCRDCGQPIAARYPLVEAAGGALAVLCCAVYGFHLQALTAFAVAAVLLPLSLIDADTMTIPDGLLVALAVPAVASYFVMPGPGLAARAIGFFAVSLPMLLLTLLIPDCFGGGDIKLMAVCGLLLGWQRILLAGFLGLLFGLAAAVRLLVRRRGDRHSHFPFGPCLAGGVFLSLLWGDVMIRWYLAFCGIL